jgi:hypothetical protein
MEGWQIWLIIIGIIAGVSFLSWSLNNWRKAKEYEQLKPRLDDLNRYKAQLESEREAKEAELKSREEHIEILVKEESQNFPWLAKAYADYLHLQDIKRAKYLEDKSHPALTAAEHMRKVADQHRAAVERYLTLRYRLERYERLFPWLVDFKDVDSTELIRQLAEKRQKSEEETARSNKSARKLLTLAEYHKLPTLEKYQLAIDLFWQGKKPGEISEIEILAKEKSQGFPWLAQAYADYLYLQDLKIAGYLENKVPAASKAAEHLREIAAKRRTAEQLYRVLKYQLEYYESLFPWLVDFKGEDIEDLIIQIMEKRESGAEAIEEPDDAAKKWLTPAEYDKLPMAEKYQLAIDRYWRKKKSRWEIGRDYERYIGYLYESRGYAVYYQGIVEGLADLGRDLICVKDNIAEVVQCKYWSKEKQIHEKHIFQLYGTVVAYRIDRPGKQVSACFVTSTRLSDRAKQFAKELGMKTLEDYPLAHYPCIKCNVSRRDSTKIYHLPFDQQYDKTLIEEERNECYVETVKEAEALGFRHAYRWKGEVSE